MRAVIVGGRGQLGHDLIASFADHEIFAPGHTEVDILDASQVRTYLHQVRPALVLNAAAFHDVAACERDPTRAFAVNARGAEHLAQSSADVGAVMVQVSTDYVFDGSLGRPLEEGDVTLPLNIYGSSKLAGERGVLAENPRSHIVRTSGLFGAHPCRGKAGGRNFVRNIIASAERGELLRVVTDQYCSPTSTCDLATQIRHLIDARAPFGLYHAVNSPGLSWFDFARMILERRGLRADLEPVRSGPSPFRRPTDSRLSTNKLRALGLLKMRSLGSALASYLLELGTTVGEHDSRQAPLSSSS
jgi:dTDP-4-dehydrorhamnose reductase